MASFPLPTEPPESAIPRLIDQYGAQIYGLALRLCGSPEAAEDLVQETFLLAFRKWSQFEGRSSPSTWLYTIATRVCRRHHRLRSGQPRQMESLSRLLPSGEEGVVDMPSPGGNPLDLLERRETIELVQRALAHLPAGFRLPLVLKDLMELSIEEIAQILGLKEATVKTRLHRARLFAARELSKGVPRRSAPPPDHARTVCLDLLRAKQEALDRGVDFPVAPDELCVRCRSLFGTLELTREACRRLGEGDLPEPVRQAILEQFRSGPRRRRKRG